MKEKYGSRMPKLKVKFSFLLKNQKRLGNAYDFGYYARPWNAGVAKLVDALDLGSSAARRESSSLSFRTIPTSKYSTLHRS